MSVIRCKFYGEKILKLFFCEIFVLNCFLKNKIEFFLLNSFFLEFFFFLNFFLNLFSILNFFFIILFILLPQHVTQNIVHCLLCLTTQADGNL